MTVNINDMQSYCSKNPDMTLEQYLNMLNEKEKTNREKSIERFKNRDQWYEALIGRYFIFNFNGVSYCAVHINKAFTGDYETKFPGYNIYRSKYKFSIEKEDRIINKFWFNCPYEDMYFGQGSTRVKEITKEEFDSFKNLYESQSSLFNSLNLD